MDSYPKNSKVDSYQINVQYEGGADGFTKVEGDDETKCCICIPAVTGFKILTVLTGLGSFGTMGLNLIPFVLMVLWFVNPNTEKTRNYLYWSQMIQLIVYLVVMIITIMSAYAVSTGAVSTEGMTEEQIAQYEQAQEEMAAQMEASGVSPTKVAIGAATPFAIGLCIQVHYVMVAKRLQANL